MPAPPDDLDARVAAFHQAGRRRKVIAFAIGGTLLLLLGAAAIVVYVLAYDVQGKGRVLPIAFSLVLAGVWFLIVSWRIATRRLDDAEGIVVGHDDKIRFR